jgi:hypothetical protein
MKDHLYIPAAFFEQLKDIFVIPKEADKIFNIEKPRGLKDSSLTHIKTFTYVSQEIPEHLKEVVDAYGEELMESYLMHVGIFLNLGIN